MGFKKSELLEEIKSKRIDFADGKFLLIDYRVRAMPYKKRKMLIDGALSVQSNLKRMKSIQKELENKSLSEVERERKEAEVTEISRQINNYNAPLVDYLGGTEDKKRPPAIVKWDLLDDNDQPLPVTREEIEDFDEETLSFLAWQLLGGADVGEANGTPSQQS